MSKLIAAEEARKNSRMANADIQNIAEKCINEEVTEIIQRASKANLLGCYLGFGIITYWLNKIESIEVSPVDSRTDTNFIALKNRISKILEQHGYDIYETVDSLIIMWDK